MPLSMDEIAKLQVSPAVKAEINEVPVQGWYIAKPFYNIVDTIPEDRQYNPGRPFINVGVALHHENEDGSCGRKAGKAFFRMSPQQALNQKGNPDLQTKLYAACAKALGCSEVVDMVTQIEEGVSFKVRGSDVYREEKYGDITFPQDDDHRAELQSTMAISEFMILDIRFYDEPEATPF